VWRSDDGEGRGGDPPGGRQWDSEIRHDGGGYPTAGAGAATGSQGDAPGGRQWDSEPRRDGRKYPTAGAGTAAGPRSALWDSGPDSDGPTAALLELGISGPVETPVPGKPDVANEWSVLAVGASLPGDSQGVAGLAHVRKCRSPLWARRGHELVRGGSP